MKLYYTSSVCSLAVRIILHELGITSTFEEVNLKTKQTEKGVDYLKINPKGSVPALMINDNELLTENAVILQYLADTHLATHLLPPVGHIQRYRTLEWLNFVSTDLHRYCSPLFASRLPEEVKKDFYTPILHNKLNIVDNHLNNQAFLMGNTLSVADSYLFVIMIWLAKLKIPMKDWPNLCRFFDNMKKLQSVQLALAEENLAELTLA